MTDADRVASHLDDVRRLADQRDDVLAVALVGSWARGDARPDSDVDVVVVVEDKDAFLDDWSWVVALGSPTCDPDVTWGLVTSRRGWHDDGTEVEYGVTDRRWTTPPIDAATAHVIGDGFRPLHDPDGLLDMARDAVS